MIFCSNRNEKLSGNLLNLYHEFEKDSSYGLTVQTFNFKRTLTGRANYFIQSVRSMYLLATSDLFIIDDYFLPVYYITNKKERNKVVQVWHAIGHLKKYGLSIEKNRKSAIKHHSNYDFVAVNAPNDIPAILSSFDVSADKVHVTGAPRLDDITKLATKKENNSESNTYLYAPTYRDATDTDKAYEYINALIASFIKKSDTVKDKLYISLHPYLKMEKIDTKQAINIEVFKDGKRSSELLKDMDVLITDYSSILLDYAYFERPIIIYAPDYHNYIQTTGFFVDYQEYIQTEFQNTADDVIELLLNYKTMDIEYVLKLKEDNFYFLDSNNSYRVYQKLNEIVK